MGPTQVGRFSWLLAALLVAFAETHAQTKAQNHADTILTQPKIYVLNLEQRALAVSGGKITCRYTELSKRLS